MCVVDCGGEQHAGGNVDTSQVNTEDASLVGSVRKHTGAAFGAKPGKLFIFTLCSAYAWIFMPCACVSSGLTGHFAFFFIRVLDTCTHAYMHTHRLYLCLKKKLYSAFLRLVIRAQASEQVGLGVVPSKPPF